jgi:hypothetical protein
MIAALVIGCSRMRTPQGLQMSSAKRAGRRPDGRFREAFGPEEPARLKRIDEYIRDVRRQFFAQKHTFAAALAWRDRTLLEFKAEGWVSG